uniref:Nudix hydrolase domain-containing protein n=1 Tax=Panagrolaimus sp. JU765 TaxID=591449 RepID=A0AC34PX75_9BILA
MIHTKCRNIKIPYLRSQIYRIEVPEEKVPWEVEWPEYNPPDYTSDSLKDYTSDSLKGKPYADPEDPKDLKFNDIDGKVNRKSHFCEYAFDGEERPLNPIGRTGLRGRGTLGRWGPNHAADPIVSRIVGSKLQFVAIKRGDNGEWAIPGGMVDPGENVSDTLKREFTEEALGNISNDKLEAFWKKGHELFRGYVDDPRNTDNSWMESVVCNFHDEDGILNGCEFKAGDDAAEVKWVSVDDNVPLYASHQDFIQMLRDRHNH